MKNLSNLTPYFTKLGKAVGSLFEAIMKIVNWFNRNDDKTDAIQKNMGDAPPLSNEGMKQNLSNLVLINIKALALQQLHLIIVILSLTRLRDCFSMIMLLLCQM